MIIGAVVAGARGNEQPLGARASTTERPPGVVAIEREAALQPATQLGKAGDPAAVCREIVTIIEPIAACQTLQREIGERRARLSDRETRMRAPLEQDDVVPLHGEHAREQ